MSSLVTAAGLKVECRTPPFGPHPASETVRSGQFMVSTLNDAAALSEDESLSPGSDSSNEYTYQATGTVKNEMLSCATTGISGPGFDFRNACQEARHLNCQFGGTEVPPLFGIDESLSKLLECMSITYRANITNPKWNPFRGLKLSVKDKIRLNNIIWREYYMQFVKKKKPVVVQFTSALSENHTNPEAIVLEGKYWKRKMEVVRQEYQACRQVLRHLSSRTKHYRAHRGNSMDACIGSHASVPRRMRQRSMSELPTGILGLGATSGPGLGFPGVMPNLEKLDEHMDFLPTTEMSLLHSNLISATSSQMPSLNCGNIHNSPSTSLLDDFTNFDDFDFGFDQNPATMWNADVMQPDLSQLQPNVDDIINLDLFPNVFHTPIIGNAPISHGDAAAFVPSMQHQSSELTNPNATGKCIEFMDVDSDINTDSGGYLSHPVLMSHHSQQDTMSSSSSSSSFTKGPPTLSIKATTLPTMYESRSNHHSTSPLHQKHVHKAMSNHVSSSIPTGPTNHDIMPANSGAFHSSLTKATLQKTTLHRELSRTSSNHLVAIAPKPEVQYSSQFTSSNNVSSRPVNQLFAAPESTTSTLRRSDMYTPSPFMSNASDTASTYAVSLTTPSPPPTSSPLRRVIEEFDTYGGANDVEGFYQNAMGRRQSSCFNIAQGFVQLEKLLKHLQTFSGLTGSSSNRAQVPSTASSGPKTSKATLLHKAADQIRRMKEHQRRMDREIEQLESQINLLQGDLNHSYSQLPATGVDLNKKPSQQGQTWFQEFILSHSSINWKFYPFSLFLKKLFFSYNVSMTSVNAQNLSHALGTWMDQCCSMVSLRQLVTDSLREMIQQTSILTDPLTVPEEIVNIIREKKKLLPLPSSPISPTSSVVNPAHQLSANPYHAHTPLSTAYITSPSHQRSTMQQHHLHVSNTSSFPAPKAVISFSPKPRRPTGSSIPLLRPSLESASSSSHSLVSPTANNQVARMPIFLMPATVGHGPARFESSSCVGAQTTNPVREKKQLSPVCITSNRAVAPSSSVAAFQSSGSSSGTICLGLIQQDVRMYADMSNRPNRGGATRNSSKDVNSHRTMQF